jgi:hypothetical protein
MSEGGAGSREPGVVSKLSGSSPGGSGFNRFPDGISRRGSSLKRKEFRKKKKVK